MDVSAEQCRAVGNCCHWIGEEKWCRRNRLSLWKTGFISWNGEWRPLSVCARWFNGPFLLEGWTGAQYIVSVAAGTGKSAGYFYNRNSEKYDAKWKRNSFFWSLSCNIAEALKGKKKADWDCLCGGWGGSAGQSQLWEWNVCSLYDGGCTFR